ncbi:MAG: TIGR03089 family protein, partial [Actinomycetota bacterium]|nr:TIGR03089 family protein [Actinomycetota bacterium]
MSSASSDIRTALVSRSDPGQPFITHLGEVGRVELSGSSVANAAAKIANALASEFDLEPGDTVGVHL